VPDGQRAGRFVNLNADNVLRDALGPRLASVTRHLRPSVAKWLAGSSVSRRISLAVALIVAIVVTSVSYVEVRSFERTLDRDLVNAAQLGVQSINDNLAARQEPLDPLDIRDVLHDLVDADPFIDAIAVVEADEHGHVHVFTSTSTEDQAEVVELAGRAIQTKISESRRSTSELIVVSPVPRHGRYAVALSVGLAGLLEARRHSLTLALGFAAAAILLVTVLVYFTVRQVLGQPLNAMLEVMERTSHGDLGARAEVGAYDEIGAIASGLNKMLDQLEHFHYSLREQIEEATRDLSRRNEELRQNRTQLLATRESLGRAERVAALGQAAANVAHQAGTPLNLVSGYVQMMLDDPRTDDRTRSRLLIVERQIQDVTRALRAMLDQARRPSGFEPTAIADIIDRVRELAQPRLSRSNIGLETQVAPDLPPLAADGTQLEMALLNLVTNALDAMPGGGTLSITGTAEANHIRLEIADTGPGIPPQILDHLFDPWVTTKPAGQGSGLGLAIVRDVVRVHSGSISAHNRGAGAVFVIELPLQAAVVPSS
jgi:signal transduction histidine kinase